MVKIVRAQVREMDPNPVSTPTNSNLYPDYDFYGNSQHTQEINAQQQLDVNNLHAND
jgi:hypothetical protein